MRLLLDEMYSPSVAAALRRRGYDVQSVKERSDLVGLDDEPILLTAAAERRALVTENIRDFMPLVERLPSEGQRHYGVLFTSRRSLLRARAAIGLHVRALDRYLRSHPREDALADSWDWVQPSAKVETSSADPARSP